MVFDDVHGITKKMNNETESNNSLIGQIPDSTNPYNSLFHQQPLTNKRPTFSEFVHRLKQQSSKARFSRDYKKLANESYIPNDDEEERVSLGIIVANQPIPDHQIEQLDILKNSKGRKIRKKVTIVSDKEDESDKEEDVEEESETSRFMTMEDTLALMEKDIFDLQGVIEYQTKRIEIAKENISYYTSSLSMMNEQTNSYLQTFRSLLKDNIPEMKAHESNILENREKIKHNRKRNLIQKARFDKYRKVINIEMRLLELEKKIKVAWKRDEISVAIRDWGFLSILVICLIMASLAAWKSL